MRVQYLILAAVAVISCERSESSSISHPAIFENGIRAEYNITYSTQSDNSLDVYYRSNASTPRAVILYVFGGGWVSGDKSQWTRDHVDFFDGLNFVSVAMNYTLNNAKGDARHPMMVNQVAQSIRWIYNNIGQYGGDPNQIYVMGASAGALLVSLVGTDESILAREHLVLKNIKGIIALDGGAYMTLDPIEYLLPSIGSTLYEPLKDLTTAYQSTFGYKPEENRDACPFYHIEKDKEIPPFLLVSQGKEIIYRYRPNMLLNEKLNSNGIKSTHFVAQGYSHFEVFQLMGSPKDYAKVGNAIGEFILRTNYDGR